MTTKLVNMTPMTHSCLCYANNELVIGVHKPTKNVWRPTLYGPFIPGKKIMKQVISMGHGTFLRNFMAFQ